MTFFCQSCSSSKPEAFMVKRSGLKLTLVGRSPMEQVVTPKVFPKDQAKFISDATIANNAGQTLAGIFLLRTFIEQYVKSEIREGKVDERLVAYGETIPENIRQQIPSLYSLYGRLSEAVHEAKADVDLFNDVRKQLELHFETKQVISKLAELK